MKTNKPQVTGKTKFKRGKAKGVSWTALRNEAIKNGTWKKGA